MDADPNLWLEDILGDKPLAWSRQRNRDAINAIGDPKDTETYKQTLTILNSKDKIPSLTRIGNAGKYYNFWQDDVHVKGIWRHTSLESYRSDNPEWHTVIDLDALNKAEGRTDQSENDSSTAFVWHGYSLLDEGPGGAWDRALINLSPGGKDADTVREFDIVAERFIPTEEKGFALPEVSKSRVAYRTRNELLVGCAYSEAEMTDSGYPRIVKAWRRGTPFLEAKLVFEGEKTDVSADQYMYVDNGHWHEFQTRQLTFYTSKMWHRKPDLAKWANEDTTPFRYVPVPDDASVGTFADSAMIELRSDWTPAVGGRTYAMGSLLVAPMEDVIAERWASLIVLFEPTETASLEGTTTTKNYIVLKVLEHVRTKFKFWRYDGAGKWIDTTPKDGGLVPVGEDVYLRAVWPDDSDDVWITRLGFLVPDTLELATASDSCVSPQRLKNKPHQFNVDGLMCEQNFAKSADGTMIPYFTMRRKDAPMDGSNLTLLDGYGGFEISETPHYSGTVGAAWLVSGGIKVIANIRGGGEYGPRWHQAALRENRFKCYEDFEAVAHDLIARGVTRQEHLACIGGSNGGLLVGNMLTRQGAALFRAIVCQVPLLDMQRYHKLLAGASWMAEYGDPDVPSDWEFLQRHSAYQRLQSKECLGDDGKWRAPCCLFTTSTRDDRVHPGHARKMVKALLDMPLERGGGPDNIYYWENIEGGHGGAADNTQRAYMWALTFNFLRQVLSGKTLARKSKLATLCTQLQDRKHLLGVSFSVAALSMALWQRHRRSRI